MKLICKHCGHISKSLDVIKDNAIAEVMLDFSKHMTEQHNPKGVKDSPFAQWMMDCQMLTSVGPTVILVAKHSNLLDGELNTEDYIQEKFSLLIEQIEEYLGVEVFDNKPPEATTATATSTTTATTIPISKEEMEEYPGKELSLPQMT